MRVAVQIPAIDEPEGEFRRTIRAIKSASTEHFDPTYEAWVTPVEWSDVTENVAEEEGLDVYEAPEGKISTRNVAHDHAVETGHDAILTIDADAPPLRDDSLDAMIGPLKDPGVVGCNSVPVASRGPDGGFSPLGVVVDLGGLLEDTFRPHMHGQASSFTAEAWEHAGPFDESVDQKDGIDIRSEEEFGFYSRLREMGEVIYPPDAVVYNDPRRHVCNLPVMEGSEYCGRIGELTFEPRGMNSHRGK